MSVLRNLFVLAPLLACLAATRPLQAQDPSPVRPDTVAAAPGGGGAAVVVGRDTLFFVRERLGSFTPAERAAAVRNRLERLADDPFGGTQEVQIVPGEATTDVTVGDVVVVTITEADARAAGTSRAALAQTYAAAVAQALREEGFSARMRIIALGVLFALMVTLATVIVFRLVNRVFPRIYQAIEQGRGTWIPDLRLQKMEIVSSQQLAGGLLGLARALRVLVLALLLYVTIPIVLSFFPWTRSYADVLFGYILTPFATVWVGFLSYLPKLFTLGAIVLVTAYLLRLIRAVFIGVARGNITFSGFYPDWAMPTYKLVRTLVILFALIASWPYLPGSDSEAFRGVGVFVGLLLSLGSASAISNVVGGVVLTYMRPFKVGDRVKISDTVGDVVEKTLLVTRIRTIKNVEITIPNSMVLGSHITNFSASARGRELVLNTTVTIGYDVPWRQVHQLLTGAARATPGVLAEPAPFVLQTSLDDFYVSYELNAHTDQPHRMAATYSTLHANIQDAFNEAGVEIMSPHYRAARDGNQTTVPAEYLPADYRVAAFRVRNVVEAEREPSHGALRAEGDGGR